MSTETSAAPVVRFTFVRENGRIVKITTDSPPIQHFLDLLQVSRARNTWVSYAHDLKTFFEVLPKGPEGITRADCVAFMQQQHEAGCSEATINRRLAAVSSLFNELHLLDPGRFPASPVHPPRRRESRQRSQSLYQRQARRVPNILSQEELQSFFATLDSWRDRTLVLLMWMSCLRVSEVVTIRFQDIECSRRSIFIATAKGNYSRTVYMDDVTFAVLNRYLDTERRNLFPEVDQVFIAFKGKARGQPLSSNALQKMIYYHAKKCGLAHLHAHLFRHTGITQLVQQGMTEPAVRDLVGHHRPDSLLPYLHLCDQFVATEFERVQGALDLTSWLDGLSAGGAP